MAEGTFTQAVGERRKGSSFGRFLLVLFAVLGFLSVLGVAALFVAGLLVGLGKGRVPDKTVLEIDFEKGVEEAASDNPFSALMLAKTPTVQEVVEALEGASGDDRVVGFVARIGAAPLGMARYQELRDAVLAFRKSGKRAVAYSDTFGEFGPGTGAYYLATAFDKIYMQPSGDVGLTGLMYESMFVRGTLDKLEIVPRMGQRYEYKNAMNMFTEKKYTDPHRESMTRLMESQFGQILRGIASARGFEESAVPLMIDKGPYLGKEALDARLVDVLAYRDEVYDEVKKELGADVEVLSLPKYHTRVGSPYAKGATIALIYGVGEVTRGRNGYDPLFGSVTMGSDSVTAAFRAAREDKDVKAIVFRVDSPGGSYVASDSIWRETVRAKQAGKPVIVTMGNVAASGGYFVAAAADKIVAQPGTITGSIGVLGGKLLMTGAYGKAGLSYDEVHTSVNSTMFSDTSDYTPEGWARFEGWLDRVYEDFTGKVADGRNLPKEKVLEVARGRVWTGEDAKSLGLVDELGGFPAALRLAREACGLAPDAPLNLKLFPRKKTPMELLVELTQGGEDPNASTLARVQAALRPYAPLLRALGLGPRTGVLTMPPVEPTL